MRGHDHQQSGAFSYISLEQRVPKDHPLRTIRRMFDQALKSISGQLSDLYSEQGRPSIAPEKLLRALLVMMLFSIRSERQLMEQLDYNLLYRWFVGLEIDEPVWVATVFSKNRQRLLAGQIAQELLEAVVEQARQQGLLSSEHFSVDGSVVEAYASKQSYHKKDDPPPQGSGRGGKLRLKDTHESATDPEARMIAKNGSARLGYMVHVLMENRHGLAMAGRATVASTEQEWKAAVEMLEQVGGRSRRGTVGADRGYDYPDFVRAVRGLHLTPHVQRHENRSSPLDERTTRHPGYRISLQKRKRIEPIFGWTKITAQLRKLRHRGRALVNWIFQFALTGYNLVRLSKLIVPPAGA